MKNAGIALFAIAFFAGNARAQGVADSLKTLTSRVTTLESQSAGGGTGSQSVKLTTEASGAGNVSVENASGIGVVTMGVNNGHGAISLFNANAALKPQIVLTISSNGSDGGLLINDKTGRKRLSYFGTIGNGTAGHVEINGTAVHDYAEVFDIADCHNLTPGSVVAASADGKGIQLSGRAYDPAAVGVLSGAGSFQPGMRIGSREDGSSDLPVAVSGQVYVRVSSEAGAIKVGDLLVSSSVPGVAMRGADPLRLTGTVIGKALQPFAEDKESLIRMLVLNR